MSCPLCRQRRGKRLCPAKGVAICSQCCGTKRRVEIDCPPDCVYLGGAHAGAWEGRVAERERDARRLGPFLERLSDAQGQLVLLSLVGAAALRARRPDLDDRLLREAVATLHKTVETRANGILYEHPAGNPRAQAVARELAELLEPRDEEASALEQPKDRDLAAALLAVERAIDATLTESLGPHAFVDTAARVAGRLVPPRAARPSRPLIVEP